MYSKDICMSAMYHLVNVQVSTRDLFVSRTNNFATFTRGDWIHLVDFLPFFDKGHNFCDLLFALLHVNPLSEQGSTLKGKKLLFLVTNSFLH